MKSVKQRILVTGGAGFIGSALVRHFIRNTDFEILNIDQLTYAGHRANLEEADHHPRHHFLQMNICDAVNLEKVFQEFKPSAVFHLAAESHVDRSIDGPENFLETNVVGTFRLLQAARRYFRNLPESAKDFRFLHISTDEVYGSLDPEKFFTESSAYEPRSPYSASKASSDHFVRAWNHTYGLPTLVTNCSNNYGPFQFPEKLIPVVILNALSGRPIPVYGRGENIRDWVFVEDHVRGLCRVFEDGQIGHTYLIGGKNAVSNLEVVLKICSILDQKLPLASGLPHKSLIQFVSDRPGHDLRYAIDFSKIQSELNWRPLESLETGLEKTVCWYLDRKDWCNSMSKYQHEKRIGLGH